MAIIERSIGKSDEIDKKSFWKMKKLLVPKSIEIAHALLDNQHNLLADPIMNKCH